MIDPGQYGRETLDRAYASAQAADHQRAQTQAAIATACLLDAILNRLDNPPSPPGACPSVYTMSFLGTETRLYCRFPDGHTGLHENDRSLTAEDILSRWTSDTDGATRLDQEQQ